MIAVLESEQRSIFPPVRVRKGQRFHLGHPADPEAPLAVLGGGHEFRPPDCKLRGGRSDCYSLEFIARGRGGLTLDGTFHPLCAGTVFSTAPALARSFTAPSSDPLEIYSVDFTGS